MRNTVRPEILGFMQEFTYGNSVIILFHKHATS